MNTVDRFVHTPTRHREVEVGGIARIDDDRMQLRSIRRAILSGAHPLAVLRVVVDVGEWRPTDAVVGRAEQPLRRSAGEPDVRFVGMARCQHEGVIDGPPGRATDGATDGAADGAGERRRFYGFLPALPEVRRAEDGRPEVAGLRRREQGASIARVKHHVVDDVAEKMRSVGSPVLALINAAIEPCPLAGGDHHQQLPVRCHFTFGLECHNWSPLLMADIFDHVLAGKFHGITLEGIRVQIPSSWGIAPGTLETNQTGRV